MKLKIEVRKAMKGWRNAFILVLFVAANGLTAPQEPEVQSVDEKISINVERMALGRVLRLWDQATAMQSSIPAELANREVTIRFSGLGMAEAVRKIFEQQSLDYVFIQGEGIIVTRASEPESAGGPGPVNADSTPEITVEPNIQEIPQVLVQLPQRPPPIVQTPFGPIVNPRGRQLVQLPPIPGEVPPSPFFAPALPPTPPAGAPNGPAYNDLFAPISIYQDPTLPPLRPPQR